MRRPSRHRHAGKIDFWKDLAMTEPDQPGGRIAYDSFAYETEEEAESALDALSEDVIAGHMPGAQ